MSVVPSLLQAIITTEGEALVLHVGEKPYVVTPTGQVDLATRGLTFDAVNGIVNEILPIESQRALDEFGAAQYALPPIVEFPGEHFTIVAARGGDDLWAEIRRRTVPDEDRVPEELFGPSSPGAAAVSMGHEAAMANEDLEVPDVAQLWPDQRAAARSDVDAAPRQARPQAPPQPSRPQLPARPQSPAARSAPPTSRSALPLIPPPPRDASAEVLASVTAQLQGAPPPAPVAQEPVQPRPAVVKPPAAPTPPQPVASPLPPAAPPPQPVAVEPRVVAPPPQPVAAPPPVAPPPQPVAVEPRVVAPPAPPRPTVVAPPPPPAPVPALAPPVATVRPAFPSQEPPPTVVRPLARSPIRQDAPAPLVTEALAGLERLLRLAAARGASTLYLSSSARPSLRVDGDVQTIDGAPVLGPNDVESLMLTLMPERNAEALRTGLTTEWICDVPDVGRVRCMSFRDHLGPGGVFRMMPVRTVTADQLGLSREIQSLAIEPEGLVLVAGPRSSGKRTLMSALVDLVNRTRRDHVITIETEINVAHDRVGSLVSQREVRGGRDEMLTIARAALREDPDVLVLEDVRTAGLMNLALDAASSGQLVIGGFPAHNATSAVDRIIDLYPPEYRRQAQLSLAQNLRGVVAQVLLRKITGGRVAAREVLLNTPAVRSLLAEGRTSQLPLAIEGGRPSGMTPLNDALVGFVQSGAVDVREAYWRAADRAGFLALLKRQGVDTSPIEKPA